MDDWLWVESPGMALSEAPNVTSTQFDDGYLQLTPTSLNTLKQSWAQVFNNVDDAIAVDMIAFLRAHVGQPFSYVPMWETVAVAVWCSKWDRTLGDVPGQSNITATFERWYAP